LANPAGAARQLLGVGRPELLDVMAGALARLGTDHALVVCSRDGLDEVSLTAPTHVREVRRTGISAWQWSAADFGLPTCTLDSLRAADPDESARRIEDVLQGKPGPAMATVLANAAAGIIVAGRAATPIEGVDLARQAVQSGRALHVLEELRKLK
jgi:anthranilate phosphoribosyltransferase